MGRIDWGPWIPTLVTVGLGLIVIGLAFDVGGLRRRLTPASEAFFGGLPRTLKLLWAAVVIVVVAQLVATVAAVTVMTGGVDTVIQLWETDTLVIALAVVVVLAGGMVSRARAQRRARREAAGEKPESDPAAAIGRGLGKLAARAARTEQGKSAIRRVAKVTDTVQRAATAAKKPQDSR